jgi:dolichol-phosphate mannosyltransferase
VVIISFFSGLTLFSLGIIAEYIWRIYEEVKNRPGYIIKKKP